MSNVAGVLVLRSAVPASSSEAGGQRGVGGRESSSTRKNVFFKVFGFLSVSGVVPAEYR